MKHLKNLLVLLAIGAGAAAFCETCHFLGGVAVAHTVVERTPS